MKASQLGNIAVSEIGMGCMGLSHSYGERLFGRRRRGRFSRKGAMNHA